MLSSIIGGYGKIGRAQTVIEGDSWSDVLRQHRFAYACDIAKEYQARALVVAREKSGWSTITESSTNLDRLYADKELVPSSADWSSRNPLLILVQPIVRSVDWEPPAASKSLVVIDARSEVDLLRGMLLVGALTTAGRLDARSRVEHPYGL